MSLDLCSARRNPPLSLSIVVVEATLVFSVVVVVVKATLVFSVVVDVIVAVVVVRMRAL